MILTDLDKFDFRAWDKIHNRMCWINKIDMVRKIVEVNNSLGDIYKINFKDIDIMRRMKEIDITGEDIFEGDVVNFKGIIGCICLLNGDWFILKTKKEKNNIILKNTNDNGKNRYEYNAFKILGNIYENPELINKIESEEE